MTEVLGEISTRDMEKGQNHRKEKIQEDCLEEVMLSCLLEEELASRMAGKGCSRQREQQAQVGGGLTHASDVGQCKYLSAVRVQDTGWKG